MDCLCFGLCFFQYIVCLSYDKQNFKPHLITLRYSETPVVSDTCILQTVHFIPSKTRIHVILSGLYSTATSLKGKPALSLFARIKEVRLS